jgi:cytochrome c
MRIAEMSSARRRRYASVAVLAVVGFAGWVGAANAADVAKGEQVFRQCAICHMVGLNAANRIGPPLNAIVGRKWASAPNYTYSAGLIAGRDKGNVWDDASLQTWLQNPRAMVPGTKMTFAGLHEQSQRDDVIAYLALFSADGAKH